MSNTKRELSAKDLKKFHPKVVAAILFLTKDQGVKYRLMDGSHILLYPVDGTSRPFKVSAQRSHQASLHFIEDFCQDNQLEEP